MSYLVLARKYRPQTFDEVYAQEHITQVLRNAIKLNRIAHAYLFTGSRGVGKTSLARIFAKTLNCLNDHEENPCNICENCVEITQGNSNDVIEIDGASNTGVDDIRELQKELLYSTSKSKYKVYIIDEVHMLSKNAFNALLKTLEEPPENVIFIFATTEPHKVIPTIISRCQRYDFKRIPVEAIVARLEEIGASENLTYDEDSLFIIAKKADGGMRDALSLMDQVISFCGNEVTADKVLNIFGMVPTDIFVEFTDCIVNKNSAQLIESFHMLLEKGNDVQELLNGFLEFLRNLLLLKVGVNVSDLPQNQKMAMLDVAGTIKEDTIIYIMSFIIKTKNDIKNTNNPILLTELALIKVSKIEEMTSLDSLMSQLTNLEKKVGSLPPGQVYVAESQVRQAPVPVQPVVNKPAVSHVEHHEHAAAPALPFNQESVKECWPALIEKLRKEKAFAASYLQNCQIEDLQNNKVKFGCDSDLSFQKLKENQEIINTIFSNHFKVRVFTEFVLKEKPKDSYIKNPTLQDIKKAAPSLAEFIEKTDSQIINQNNVSVVRGQ